MIEPKERAEVESPAPVSMSQTSSSHRSAGLTRARVGELWIEHAATSNVFPQIVIAISFFIAFGVIRGITYGIRYGWLPFGNITPDGTHIHHYVWGIGILLLIGFIEIAYQPRRFRNVFAAAFGIAEALILDEFALLLNLRDVYWTGQGRESIDAVIIAASLLILVILLRPFFRAIVKEFRHR